MLKWISMLVLGGAVIAAAGAGIYIMNARESVARSQLRTAESREAAAKDAARQAQSEEKTAIANENAKVAEAKAAEEARIAREAERVTAVAAEAKARADNETAKLNKAAREAEAAAAADAREAERAKADAAQAEAAKEKAIADAEAAKAQAEADKLERTRLTAEAVIAEEKLWELKQQDLLSLEQELLEYKKELDERELALRPEKTIKDLVAVAEIPKDQQAEDSVLLPENNPDLPKADRRLARVNRLRAEDSEKLMAKSRGLAIGKVERLYVEAVRANRVTDAEYYRKTLKSLYPDWEYRPPKQEDENKEEEGINQ